MSNQGLLKNPPKCEYPTEFLVARLQGKKSRLFQDWEKLLSRTDLQDFLLDTPFYPYLAEYGNGAMWRYLADEYQWVYVRMNPSLRKLFAPYFIFRQSESLLVSLRFLHKKGSLDEVGQQMGSSLLNNDLRAALTSGRDFTGVIEEAETQLCIISKDFNGLSDQYAENGFHGLETFLMERLIAYIASLQADRLLSSFVQRLVDHRNCLIDAKALRWKQKIAPRFLPGGTQAIDLFEKAFSKNDMRPIFKLFRVEYLPDALSSLSVLETALLNNITKTLKTWSRFRSATAYILFYLWEQFRYTRNISLILHTVMLDDELVSEHIII